MTDGPRIEGYPDLDRGDWEKVPPAPFVDHVGLVFDLLSPDRIEGHLEADERHHQPYGLVHGGVYCTVVETMASVGAALRVMGEGRAAVGVSNTTDFLRSVRHGRIDAVATPIHVGRLQHLWQVELTDASTGRLAARGQVRMQVIDPERVAPA